MGLYFRPDGPFDNPAELLPAGKIEEAREAQVLAAEQMIEDMGYISGKFYDVGCEGINFDTCGSSGDADLYAALKAVENIKKNMPGMAVGASAIS
ncbi:MAG: hypothetical protein GY774_41070 [Planctomycetes bacterium]|nr:hypothetical protein [Planctomycetota bacterium]